MNGTGRTEATKQGPPADLPDVVPDFVTDIHSTIRDAFDSIGTGLGELISSVATEAVMHLPAYLVW